MVHLERALINRSLFVYSVLFSLIPGTITIASSVAVITGLRNFWLTLHAEREVKNNQIVYGLLLEASIVALVSGVLQFSYVSSTFCKLSSVKSWKWFNLVVSLLYFISIVMFLSCSSKYTGNIYLLYYLLLLAVNFTCTLFISFCLTFLPQLAIDTNITSDFSKHDILLQGSCVSSK